MIKGNDEYCQTNGNRHLYITPNSCLEHNNTINSMSHP